jgi:hypothetical protein
VLDGLSLRIENGAFRHHPNMCFHCVIITVAQPFLAVRLAFLGSCNPN